MYLCFKYASLCSGIFSACGIVCLSDVQVTDWKDLFAEMTRDELLRTLNVAH